jgi:gamma-glutamyl-gamma-aminobutyraldehyde dehydrogenase
LHGIIPACAQFLRYHAEAINKVYGKVAPASGGALGLVVREALGVCGLILPWNSPLYALVNKLGPALATGNCVVLKPSEMTSLTALKLAKLSLEAGVPPGVINVVPGFGKVGAAISSHMDVDMIGFTGSTLTGRRILKASADSNMKKCALELGGKSPIIVFDDCSEDDEGFDSVVMNVFAAAFANQGQNCMCGSRLLVQRGIKDRLVKRLIENIKSGEFKTGDPLHLDTFNGPMISAQHASKVMGFVEQGKAEGAKLLVGGERSGNHVSMTIFDEVDTSMAIHNEEIFGPVLSILTFDTEKEAIELANATKYGLFASVFTLNINRAHRVSRQVVAGTVSINCYSEGDESVPFGGHKQSGFSGCDKSIMAFDNYQQVKTVWLDVVD